MKMSKQDYGLLKMRIEAVISQQPGAVESTRAFFDGNDRIKDTERALRWNLLWASGGTIDYDQDLTNDHIDTALRRIMKELRND